jgi:hypothetical protein
VIISPHTGRSAVQNVEVVHWGQIQEFMKFEQLMKHLGLGVHCRFCTQAFGPPNDGIQLKVNEVDRTATITCNHKERRFKVESGEQMKIVLGH